MTRPRVGDLACLTALPCLERVHIWLGPASDSSLDFLLHLQRTRPDVDIVAKLKSEWQSSPSRDVPYSPGYSY